MSDEAKRDARIHRLLKIRFVARFLAGLGLALLTMLMIPVLILMFSGQHHNPGGPSTTAPGALAAAFCFWPLGLGGLLLAIVGGMISAVISEKVALLKQFPTHKP